MEPGRLAPCIAHDVDGGVGKFDLALILYQIHHDKLIVWDDLKMMLDGLRKILTGKDKQNLATRLPGNQKSNIQSWTSSPIVIDVTITSSNSDTFIENSLEA